jgi:hypothetical protein
MLYIMKNRSKNIIQIMVAGSIVFAALFTSSVQAQQPAPIKNIVLVHGAFVDGSGWKPVYDILIGKGYHVSVVQQPLTSFDADLAAVKRTLDLQEGPCILVGHSYGGGLITEAGNDQHVAGLIKENQKQTTENVSLRLTNPCKSRPMVSTISTRHSFQLISRPTFPSNKQNLWQTRRCLLQMVCSMP